VRVVRYLFSPECLADLLVAGINFKPVDGIPPAAKIIRAGYDQEKDTFFITAEHESFDLIPEGKVIPERYVSMSQWRDPA
jgi:hypothetical protein